MAKSRRKSQKGLDTKTLVAGAIGVSPIPVLGEIYLSYFFHRILEEQKALPQAVSIPAALLTRYCMWTELYLPIYRAIFE